MTGRDLFQKWLTYSLLLLPILFLERLVFPHIPLFPVLPVLLPFAAVMIGMLEGTEAGVSFGLFVGLLCDICYYHGASLVFFVPLLGLYAGILSRHGLHQSLWGALFCFATSLMLIDITRILPLLLSGKASLAALLRVAGPELLLSLLFSPLVYVLYRLAYRKVGGSVLM